MLSGGVELGSAFGRIELDTSPAGKAVAALQGQLDAFQEKLGGFSKGLQNAGKGLSISVTAPLLAIGGAALKAATDFNAGMANVASLGVPIKRVGELKTAVQDMAVSVGKDTGDLSDGLYQVISAFGDTADTTSILAINAQAAAAGLATTTDAINLTSAVTKGYGDTSAAAVQKVSDLAFTAVRLGQTTFPELASSIGKVVPLTKQLGVSQEELFGVMATATGVTGNASEVSTQLRGAMQSLMAPTADMSKLLKQMGVSSGEALIQQRGLQGAIETIVGAAEKSGKPLSKFVGSIEGQTLAMALAGPQADVFTEKLAAMGVAAGASEEAFAAQTEGINAAGFSMKQLKVQATVIAQNLGDGLAPALGVVLTTIKPVVGWIETMSKRFAAASPATQRLVVGALGVAAALGPLAIGLGTVLSVVSSALPAVAALGGALTLLTGPLGLVTLGIGALAFDVGGLRTKTLSFLGSVIDNASKTDGALGDLARALDSLRKYFGLVVSDGDAMNDWLMHLPSFVQGPVEVVGTLTAGVISLADAFKNTHFTFGDGQAALKIGDLIDLQADWSLPKPVGRLKIGDVVDFTLGDQFTKLKIGDLVDFTSFPGLTKLKLGDLVDFTQTPDITRLSLGQFVDFTKLEGLTKLKIGDIIDFSKTGGLTKLAIGDVVDLTHFTGFTKIAIGDLVDFTKTPDITRLTLGQLVDFGKTEGITKLKLGSLVDFSLSEGFAKFKLGDLVDLSATMTPDGMIAISFNANQFDIDWSGTVAAVQTGVNDILAAFKTGDFSQVAADVTTGVTGVSKAMAGVGSAVSGYFASGEWTETLLTVGTAIVGPGALIAAYFSGPLWVAAEASVTEGVSGLGSAASDYFDSPEWAAAKARVSSGVGSIGTSITGYFASVDWTNVGLTVMGGIGSIGPLVQGFFESPTWTNAVGYVTTGLTTLGGNVQDYFNSPAWAHTQLIVGGGLAKVGSAVGDFFSVSGAFGTILSTITTTLDGFSTTLDGLDATAIGQKLSDVIGALAAFNLWSATIEGDTIAKASDSLINLGTSALNFANDLVTGIDPAVLSTGAKSIAVTMGSEITGAFGDEENFKNFGAAAGKFVGTVVTKLGSALSDPDLGQDVGKAVGESVSAITVAAAKLVTGFATELGKVDWVQFKADINTFTSGFATGVAGAIGTVDWGPVGKALVDAVARAVGEAIDAALPFGFFGNRFQTEMDQLTPPEVKAKVPALDIQPPEWNIPDFKWSDFVEPLAWPVADFKWYYWISPLTWPVAQFKWSDWVVALDWGVADFKWYYWISPLTWPVSKFDWGDWINKFKWPSISTKDLVDAVARFFKPPAAPAGPGGTGSGGGTGGAGAIGSSYARNRLTLVGERGREFLLPRAGDRILTNGQSNRMAAASAGDGVNVNVYIDRVDSAIDVDDLAWRVANKVRQRRRA
jgi:TP901 family phage tail tape measure protein